MTTARQSGTFAVSLLGSFEPHRENRTAAVAPAAQRLLAYVATRTKTITRVAAAGMAAIGCDPLRESAHRAIVRVHLAEALRQYDLYRRLSHREPGLRPYQHFRALVSHLPGRPGDGSRQATSS